MGYGGLRAMDQKDLLIEILRELEKQIELLEKIAEK
jgi:hypothetical protein